MTNRLLATAHGTNREAFEPIDWGLFLGLSFIWGASFLFIEIGLDHFHPGLVTLLRVGFGASFMAALPKARRTHIPVQDLKKVAALGVIWIAVPLTLFPIAQQWIDSAVAGMLNGAVPIFTALIASILLSQLPGRLQMIGLGVGFVGIMSIALPSAESGTTAAVGVVMVLAATVCYGFATNIVAPIQQKYGSLAVMARAQWFAVVLVLPYGIYGLTKSDFGWNSLLAVLAVGLLGTGLAFVMMGSLIGRVGPTRASFITYLIPVVALVLGVALLGETVSPLAVIGSVLVIVGALLASRREGATATQGVPSTNMTGDEPT